MEVNKYQTQLTDDLLESLNKEVREDLLDAINTIPIINRLISLDRKYAKDLPRDEKDRIIVDLCDPHILEDMDYFREAALHYKEHGIYTKLRPNGNPNSAFGMWINREIKRIWHGMVRPEDGEWVTGDMYFYLNYTPIIQSKIKKGTKIADRVVDFPTVWEGVYLWFHYINQARYGGKYNNFEGGNHCVEIAKRGASKAHPYSQVVPTPEGKKLWGDIQIGDYLFGDDGKYTKVIDIPFDETTDIYNVTLKDGRTIQASEDHLWKVWKHTISKQKEYVLSTKELLADYCNPRKVNERNPSGKEYIYRIPKNNGVDFEEKEVTIDPYTLGLILGDGCFVHGSCYFTSEDADFKEIKDFIPYDITKWKTKYSYNIKIPEYKPKLKSYNLDKLKSERKFIPDDYKYNTREVRLEILKGLFDSDGFVDKKMPVITLTSKQMIYDVAEICRSLGINCSINKYPAGYKKDGIYIKCQDAYTLRAFTDIKFFKLPRKIAKQKELTSNYAKSRMERTTITNIEFSHKEQAKCVTVDNKSSCYLVGDYVTTHNSYTCASMLARLFVVGDNEDTCKEVISVITAYLKDSLTKDGTLNKFEKAIDFCAENTQFPSKRINSTLDKMFWKMGYIDNNTETKRGTLNEVIGVTAKDNVDKARGKRASKFIYEELN